MERSFDLTNFQKRGQCNLWNLPSDCSTRCHIQNISDSIKKKARKIYGREARGTLRKFLEIGKEQPIKSSPWNKLYKDSTNMHIFFLWTSKKAYDSIDSARLINILRKLEIPDKLINTINWVKYSKGWDKGTYYQQRYST